MGGGWQGKQGAGELILLHAWLAQLLQSWPRQSPTVSRGPQAALQNLCLCVFCLRTGMEAKPAPTGPRAAQGKKVDKRGWELEDSSRQETGAGLPLLQGVWDVRQKVLRQSQGQIWWWGWRGRYREGGQGLPVRNNTVKCHETSEKGRSKV